MTKISIAMATYNGARFIRPQLDSFSRQTLLPNELIVCDDGSTDSTLSIISDFSHSAPFPVQIVSNPERLGHTANFFKAARMCRGDLIAFSDQDDEWSPQKLDRIHQASLKSDALLFGHSAEWIDKDGKPMGVIYPLHRRYRKYLLLNDFPGHSMVFRRSLLEITSLSLSPSNYLEVAADEEFGHDILLLEIANAMRRVLFVPDALTRWRVYHQTRHAWTGLLGFPPRDKVHFAEWLFPPNLAQRYAKAALSDRRHSALLSCIIRDLKAFGGDTAGASVHLAKSVDLMTTRADVLELRARFYASRTRKARMGLMLEGATMGQYRHWNQGGVGVHNALRDMLACLLC